MQNMFIETIQLPNNAVTIDKGEALRYMGYGKFEPDAAAAAMIDDCLIKAQAVCDYKACFAVCPVSVLDDSQTDLSFMQVSSKTFAKHMQGCSQAIVFAATVGIGADRLIGKYSRLSPAKAVMTDGIFTAAIESFCDLLCDDIFTGRYGNLKFRYSPGYGDFPLPAQRTLLQVLNANVKIGVSLTDSLLMTPTKSVSAIVGIVDKEE